jgi:Zn-dependent peptidase ImmA (M78 family)
LRTKRTASPTAQARTLLETLCIRTPPIPLDKAAEHFGAKIRRAPLDDELSGIIFIRDNIPIIGINAIHHPNRQRFTLAHELGHLVLHKSLITNMVHVDKSFPFLLRDSKAATGIDKIEIEANQFAAELLMPEMMVLRELESHKLDIDDEILLDALGKKFLVSKQAMSYRIQNIL